MADPSSYTDPGNDTDMRSDGEGMPRWVKAFAIIAIVVALLVIVVMVALGGEHGPARHTSSSDPGGATAVRAVAL